MQFVNSHLVGNILTYCTFNNNVRAYLWKDKCIVYEIKCYTSMWSCQYSLEKSHMFSSSWISPKQSVL